MKSSLLFAFAAGASAAQLPKIAGYVPGSDVVQHSRIDMDVALMDSFLGSANWAEAKAIYTSGKNSLKSSGVRNLKAFSNNKQKLKGEAMADLYAKYWGGNYAYADTMVMAALDGTGVYKNAAAVAREEIALKVTQYQVVWQYVLHELEDAVNDCRVSVIADNDAGVHAWDEGWAFYAGSLEGTKGEGAGQLLYALADKRCSNFKTCGPGGLSKVNMHLLTLFQKGEDALSKGFCNEGAQLLEEIKPLMTVPLIQGALRYAYKADPKANPTGGAKEQAEGWAFASAVLPQINQYDAAAATMIKANMEYGAASPVKDGYVAVYQAFQRVYKQLGITCADVGGLVGEDARGYFEGTEPCDEFVLQFQSADSLAVSGVSTNVILSIVNFALIIFLLGVIVYLIRRKAPVGYTTLKTTDKPADEKKGAQAV